MGYSLLKYNNIKFDRVILCGSILPEDFPWRDILERGQVNAVRNEFGTDDFWSNSVRWFVAGTGASGKKGFWHQHPRLFQQEFSFKHSEYFDRGHMDAYWIPFICEEIAVEGVVRELPVHRPRPNIPWGLYGLYLIIAATAAIFLIPRGHLTGAVQIQSQLHTATDRIAALESQLEVAQGERDFTKQKLAAAEQQLVSGKADEERIRQLQSELKETQQERDKAKENLGTLQSELSSKNVELGNIRQHVTTLQSQLSETQRELTDIRNRDETRIGPNTSIGFVDVLTLSDALKTIPKTLVLLTSTPDNEQLRSLLENMFAAARARLGGKSQLIIMGRPNYDKELDAPRLQETPGNGITIHGRNPAGDYLMQHVFAMNNCFNRRQTAKTPDEFLTYYHLIGGANDIKDIAWIEIGNSPVLRFSGCLNQ